MIKHERFTLSNGKDYILEPGAIVRTTRVTNHGDWKTVIAKNIPPVPAGVEIPVIDWFFNFYGRWITVRYDGRNYDISPKDLEYVSLGR